MFTRVKFLSLSRKQQHKHLMRLLAHAVAQDLPISDYNRLASFLGFPLLDMQTESISDRYHLHAKEALPHIKESDLLRFRCVDRLSRAPWLPVDIYLDALRSAANVGSILRTVEAFRLGTVFLSPRCAGLDRKKCRDSAMGCDMIVPVHTIPNPSSLRTPGVARKGAEGAASRYAFPFPPKTTPFVGNKKWGFGESGAFRHF